MTRHTDTSRTGVEQMLISDAVDRSLSQMTFDRLAGRSVFVDGQYLDGVVDKSYVVSSVREKLFREGAVVQAKLEDAEVVVELRVGSLGTNRYEWFVGVPQVAASGGAVPLPAFIPEIPLLKRTRQEGMAKISAFAYERESKQFLADTGARFAHSDNQSLWLVGMGPYERGTIRRAPKESASSVPPPEDPPGEHALARSVQPTVRLTSGEQPAEVSANGAAKASP